MLTASRAFTQSARSAPLLPRVPEFAQLYEWGIYPRQGQLIMVAGRPGSQKSGFTLFWVAQMNLPTLYMSGDMTPFEATSRLVSMKLGEATEQVEAGVAGPDAWRYKEALTDSKIVFSFGQPITFPGIEAEIEAWVEAHNSYPPVIVIDNLMDIDGCESSYDAQTEAMQLLSSLSRETGSTVIVIHHATDKSIEASAQPGYPPARREIKNGLAEKPQLTLTVALEPESSELRVACVKQRSGRSDASAHDFVRLRAFPEVTRFSARIPGS